MPTRKTESEECIGETKREIKGGLGNGDGRTESTIRLWMMWEAMKARMDATGGR